MHIACVTLAAAMRNKRVGLAVKVGEIDWQWELTNTDRQQRMKVVAGATQ